MKEKMLLVLSVAAFLLCCSAELSFAVNLPKPGQKKCFNTAGSEIICSGTGQAAEKRYGTSWPNPRFTDNKNGTVTDNLTGLIWLKNANCTDTIGGINKSNGDLTWANAFPWTKGLASGKCGLTDSSQAGAWRLPQLLELESLAHEGYNEQTCGPSPCITNAEWLNTQGFTGAQPDYYWSASVYAGSTNSAWNIFMFNGGLDFVHKDNGYYVWPVRDGH